MKNVNLLKAMIAGIAGTVAMTIVSVYVAPMMGMPKMNPADMLAGQMGGSMVMGWAGHFMIGIVFAVAYAFVAKSLPGAPWMRGALFGVAPWLLAQAAVMPMMGMSFFSGSMLMAGGSLIGHVIYGTVVGATYGAHASVPRTANA